MNRQLFLRNALRRFCTKVEEKAVTTRKSFQPVNPATGQVLPAIFEEATVDDVKEAAIKAAMAFPVFRTESLEARAKFLETIAEEIEGLGEKLLVACNEETGLPMQRLTGERFRTVSQLRMFAEVVREGIFLDATLDTPDPKRTPMPKPDLRTCNIPIGPVAVFGASNFPLAFSVAGGDTASALAAGNSVVVKGHPAHPYTSQLVADAVAEAVKKCDLPEGTFQFLHGVEREIGVRLVQDPNIQAVGFTGSFQGGRALADVANARPQPIPVYAEMGSSNPLFILPGALEDPVKLFDLAKGLANSVTMGVGQFCTKPGLIFMLKDKGLQRFQQILQEDFQERFPTSMLTSGIASAYSARLEELMIDERFEVVGQADLAGQSGQCANAASATLLRTSCQTFLADSAVEEEVFGPAAIICVAENEAEMLRCAERLGGHLTVTVHGTVEDFDGNLELMDVLQQKAGRVVINGFPTGVEVCNAMIHGGPYPATTVPRSTSVGKKAIDRFVRPVCYQNAPQNILPDALVDSNPLGIVRNIDGILTTDDMNSFLLNYKAE